MTIDSVNGDAFIGLLSIEKMQHTYVLPFIFQKSEHGLNSLFGGGGKISSRGSVVHSLLRTLLEGE